MFHSDDCGDCCLLDDVDSEDGVVLIWLDATGSKQIFDTGRVNFPCGVRRVTTRTMPSAPG